MCKITATSVSYVFHLQTVLSLVVPMHFLKDVCVFGLFGFFFSSLILHIIL